MNKKYLGMLGLGCGVLLLTACGGGKTLKCEYDMSDQLAGLGKWTTEINLDYDSDGKKIESATMKMIIEVTNEDVTDEMMDSLKSNLETVCNTDGADFEKCDVKKSGKKITLEAKGDAESIGESAEVTKETSLEDAKKLIEKAGYTCK